MLSSVLFLRGRITEGGLLHSVSLIKVQISLEMLPPQSWMSNWAECLSVCPPTWSLNRPHRGSHSPPWRFRCHSHPAIGCPDLLWRHTGSLDQFLDSKVFYGVENADPAESAEPTECAESTKSPEAGVLKKLSSAGLAKLSRPRYSWLRFGLASAGYRGLGVYGRPECTAGYLTADSTEHDEIPGVSQLSLAELG